MKILRAYAVTAIICLSITSVIACIFIADENAKRITLGNESAVAVISSSAEKLGENMVDFSGVFEKIINGAKKAAGYAPPPINNIYWFAVNSEIPLN